MDVKKIILKGKKYWIQNNIISPLSHFDKDGNFLPEKAFRDGFVSYAVIEGDDVLRYGQIIGSVKKDIKYIKEIK